VVLTIALCLLHRRLSTLLKKDGIGSWRKKGRDPSARAEVTLRSIGHRTGWHSGWFRSHRARSASNPHLLPALRPQPETQSDLGLEVSRFETPAGYGNPGRGSFQEQLQALVFQRPDLEGYR
jgi:hypothetical protein